MNLDDVTVKRTRELARLRMKEHRKRQRERSCDNHRRFDDELMNELFSDNESNELLLVKNPNSQTIDYRESEESQLYRSDITSRRNARVHSDEETGGGMGKSMSEISDNFVKEYRDETDDRTWPEYYYDCEEGEDDLEKSIEGDDIREASLAEEDFSDFDDEIEAPEIDQLRNFIDELDELHANGLMINGRLFRICIKAFVCDTPARALLKKIKGHGAYWACERCTVKGEYEQHRVIYPGVDGEERTDESFREQRNPEHHTGVSPLLKAKPAISVSTMIPKYKCVVFPRDRGRLKSIDGVPSTWIYYDPSVDKLFSFYPETQSHDHKRREEIQAMIKANEGPDKSWTVHEVEIRGIAETYEDLEEKLSILSKQSFAFTSDTDVSPEQKGFIEKEKYKRRVKSRSAEMSQLFEEAQQDLKKQTSSSGAKLHGAAIRRTTSKQVDGDPVTDLEESVSSADGSTSTFEVSLSSSKPSKRRLSCPDTSSETSSPHVSPQKKNKKVQDNKRSRSKGLANTAEISQHVEVNAIIQNSRSKGVDQLKDPTVPGPSKDRRDDYNMLTSTPQKTSHESSADSNDKPKRSGRKLPPSPNRSTNSSSSVHSGTSPKPMDTPSPRFPLKDVSNRLITGNNSRGSPQGLPKGYVPQRSKVSFPEHVADLEGDGLEDEGGTLKEIMINCCRHVRMNGQRIDRLKGQVVEIKNEIAHLRTVPQRGQLVDGFETESEGDEVRDGFKLPCKTLAELKIFDRQLQVDKAYRKRLCQRIHGYIDKERTISRNLGEIIRKFLTQNVGNKLTPLKKMEGKEVFKELKFYSRLVALFGLKLGTKKEPLDRKKFNDALKGVLNNSGDWEGGRSKRGKRTKSKQSSNAELSDGSMEDILPEK
ncbi:LOW QUALITY PROTEIN: uncharacterized protein LOC107044531 [Diachasma alloeum]|uniref:LOW QUALITY PROTEIN: uncharacterized protein LOC107044531 n=1 Tax=Diachasma alloeum TaxID=454923 RepID=UPI00073830A6|nr:LOW QUALITY PROTEIN: uncharacterized protein LOC107044531 [Diachasma alloeum]